MLTPAPPRRVKDAVAIVFEELCNEFTPKFRTIFRQMLWPPLTECRNWEDELTEEEYQQRLAQMRRNIRVTIRDVFRREIPSRFWLVDRN